MAHPDIDTHLNPQAASRDSAQVRLKHFLCLQFIGASAPQRITKFVREYVNEATLTGADASNPADYTIADQGLPAALLHTIYFSDGMWYIFFVHNNPNYAATFPFITLTNPSDTGYDQ